MDSNKPQLQIYRCLIMFVPLTSDNALFKGSARVRASLQEVADCSWKEAASSSGLAVGIPGNQADRQTDHPVGSHTVVGRTRRGERDSLRGVAGSLPGWGSDLAVGGPETSVVVVEEEGVGRPALATTPSVAAT